MTNPPPAEGRRPSRTSSLSGSAIADLGERTVGHSREKLENDRKAIPRRRMTIALVITSLVVGLPLLYMYSASKKAKAAGAALTNSSTVEGADANALPANVQERAKQAPKVDSTSAATASAAADSFPTIAFDSPTPAKSTPAAATPAGAAAGSPSASGPTPDASTVFNGRPARTAANGGALPAGGNGNGNVPLLPPSAMVPATPAFAAPTLQQRMDKAGFTAVTSSGNSSTSTRRPNALNVSAVGTQGTNGTTNAATSTATQNQGITPGTRAAATVRTGTPSAASGEPITIELTEAVVDHGREVLPAGTIGIGMGTNWNDGTGNARLDLKFSQWVLPNGTVKQYPARAFSPDDDRPGLAVPFTRQLARKGENIAANVAAALAMGKLAQKVMPPGYTGDGYVITPPPQQQALQDVWKTTQNELNLTQPAVGVLFRLEAGTPLTVVFGMP